MPILGFFAKAVKTRYLQIEHFMFKENGVFIGLCKHLCVFVVINHFSFLNHPDWYTDKAVRNMDNENRHDGEADGDNCQFCAQVRFDVKIIGKGINDKS